MEKILYVWAIRHPASGYVQGINDLATPFYQVFLSSYIGKLDLPAARKLGLIASAQTVTPRTMTYQLFPHMSSQL